MKPFTIIFLCFLVIPTAEIYLLIQIGQVIGAGWTIFGVVATAVVGAWLIRIQGILTLHRGIESLRRKEVPAIELIEGLFLLICAALLITPGFVTDSIGFLCLVTPVRRALAAMVLQYGIANMKKKQGSEGQTTFETKFREIK
ncbi:MAG: FxsA family protein [Gammaproteobacteria bacterium]|nr:FxsA family protein [Gammaproteobacteria bacterium]